MVRDTPSSQDASTHQIWNAYLKEYRRYAPDTKRDGHTDSAITICLPKFLWGHKKQPFDPIPGVVGVCNDSIFALMVLCAQFPLIWYATWLLSEKDIVCPLGQGCVCGQNICYHVDASFVSFNLICNMTTFRKISSLTFWHHPLGQGCVCGKNICYHAAASVASFNLICNMTIFWKS